MIFLMNAALLFAIISAAVMVIGIATVFISVTITTISDICRAIKEKKQ